MYYMDMVITWHFSIAIGTRSSIYRPCRICFLLELASDGISVLWWGRMEREDMVDGFCFLFKYNLATFWPLSVKQRGWLVSGSATNHKGSTFHRQMFGVTHVTDSQIITQSGIIFLLQNKFFIAGIIENLFCNKKSCSSNKKLF